MKKDEKIDLYKEAQHAVDEIFDGIEEPIVDERAVQRIKNAEKAARRRNKPRES